eukprot:4235135-Pleurochrysis_carterae.AAC.1
MPALLQVALAPVPSLSVAAPKGIADESVDTPLFPSPPSIDSTPDVSSFNLAPAAVPAAQPAPALPTATDAPFKGLTCETQAGLAAAQAAVDVRATHPPKLLAGDQCEVAVRSDKGVCTTGLVFKKDPKIGNLLVAFDDGCWEPVKREVIVNGGINQIGHNIHDDDVLAHVIQTGTGAMLPEAYLYGP